MYDESNDRHTATKETVECVLRIWAEVGIKTQLYRSCIRMLKKLWIQWKDIDKQKTGKDDERREGFSRKMDNWTAYGTAKRRVIFIRSCQAFFLVKRKRKKALSSIKISVRSERGR